MGRIRGTYYLTKAGVETTPERDLILRRRIQILVHSCIYYRFDENLVSDRQWDQWARELVSLQKKYPKIAERVDYHEYFKDFDGTTGFDLPIGNPEIVNKALWLVEYHKELNKQDLNKKKKKKKKKKK